MKQNMNIAFIPSSALRLLDFMHSCFFSEKLKGTKKTSCKNGTWLNIDSRWEDEGGFFYSQSAFALFIYGFFWLAKWLLKQRKLDVAQQFHPIDMNAIRKTTEMPSMTFLKQRVENHSSGNKKSHLLQLNILTHSLAFQLLLKGW